MVTLYANKIIRLVHATLCDGPQSRLLLNVARPSFALIIVAGENRDTDLLSGVQRDQISIKHRQIFQLRFYSLRVFYHRPLISHCLVSLHLSTYFGSIYCVWRVSFNMERMVSLKLSSLRCCPKLEAMAGHYESIYRLVLITQQSQGPVAGAIAGKRRSGILGPRSPLNQPWARRWVLALAIPHQPPWARQTWGSIRFCVSSHWYFFYESYL